MQKEEINQERLLDMIERQKLIIDSIFFCIDDATKKRIICEVADRIYQENNKKESYNSDNN